MKSFMGLLLPLLLSATMAEAGEGTASELVLRGDFAVSGVVLIDDDEEEPITLVVDGASPSRPILNPELVDRADIGKSMIGGGFLIGPIELDADTKVVKYRFGDLDWKSRSLWTDLSYAPNHDGGVGPLGLPHDVVRIQWRREQAGEKLCTFPLDNRGSAVTRIAMGEKIIDIGFTQKRGKSLSTAAAGAVIADFHDGEFVGESDSTEIAYGIERPIRKLALAEPLDLCGVSLDSFYVRKSDFGDSSGIIDGDLARANADSSEIVVMAANGKKDKNRYFLTIGQDDLQHCSSVTYDKVAKEIRLSCFMRQ
ncbi:hypothetical protein [Alterisphingorhabdus coralli]|uniref:Secreted protein n=1 Tax=Alterisphingorhabdus coralli TaxID=3071408 RepID=A0AA97F604_9SPHN|nr:hypothetical protein [Parasphingorhabdus sp. SCSIO 66989]WOE74578.1 hypothetical protein RB602_12075 [Parasphingorhabdus sp. SCSIO 66989]